MSRVNEFSPSSSLIMTHRRYRPGNPSVSPEDGQFGLNHSSTFQNTRRGTPLTHYWPFEERLLLPPSVVTSSIPMDTYSRPTRIIIVNNHHPDHRMNPNIPPFLHQFTHRPVSRENTYVPPTDNTDESRLTKDEQETVLKNLHRQTYNHLPKSARKVNLYYRDLNRDPNSNALGKNEDGKICAVCLEDFEHGEEVMVTTCKHMFHEGCIIPWVKSHGNCPVCRFALCDRENVSGMSMNRGAVLQAEHGLFSDDIVLLIRALDETFVRGG